MKLIKEIFGRLFALWALVWFVATMLVFMIICLPFCYFQPEPKKTYRFIRLSRIWMGIYLPMIGCPLRIRGKNHFADGENYIVVCNHNSLMDVPVSSPAIPGGNKTIAKAEMAKIPLFGTIYKIGSVLVDRKSDSSRKDSYMQMKRVLDMGLHMCIYPEGTRNRTQAPLKSFHDGAFKLALTTGKAVLPAVLFHSRKVLPPSKPFYLMPHPLEIHFLEPVKVESLTVEELKQKVYKKMEAYFLANNK